MNLCTRNLRKAARAARRLANIRQQPVAVFYPANAPNWRLFAESPPSWWAGKEKEWCDMMRLTHCARIYQPTKGAR